MNWIRKKENRKLDQIWDNISENDSIKKQNKEIRFIYLSAD